jgi:hypothetical protein
VNIRWYVGLNSETVKQPLTGVLVGVDVVEVVGLLGELYFGMAVAELLHHEGVVLPHNLPDQVSWNRRHFPSPKTQYNSRVRLQLNATETEKKGTKMDIHSVRLHQELSATTTIPRVRGIIGHYMLQSANRSN